MDQISVNLQMIINALPEVIEQRVDRACQLVENEGKRNCPVDDGTLRASITHTVERTNTNIVGTVGTNVEYAPYVHEGTGIYAKDGNGRQNIPWTYRDARGKFHRTKGRRPKEFLRKAFDDNMDNIRSCFEGALYDTL